MSAAESRKTERGSEPAALDLAAHVQKACERINARYNGYWPTESERSRIVCVIEPLLDDLERCRAERDALRARVLTLASNVAFLHGAHHPLNVAFADCDYSACRGARAALGEVTQ